MGWGAVGPFDGTRATQGGRGPPQMGLGRGAAAEGSWGGRAAAGGKPWTMMALWTIRAEALVRVTGWMRMVYREVRAHGKHLITCPEYPVMAKDTCALSTCA